MTIRRVLKVKRGTCGHAAVKTILAAFGCPEVDEAILDGVPERDGGGTDSRDIERFLTACGLFVTSARLHERLYEVERELAHGVVGLVAVKIRPEPAPLHWILLVGLHVRRGVAVIGCALSGVRVSRLQAVLDQVQSPVWLVRAAQHVE